MTMTMLVVLNLIFSIIGNLFTIIFYLSVAQQNKKLLESQAKLVEATTKTDIKSVETKIEDGIKKIL